MNYEVADFSTDVIEKSRSVPVLVDFWAEWCGPCRTLSPVLEQLAKTNEDRWVLVKVDTENHPDLSATYGIRGIPNVKLFIDGEVKDEFTGALPEHMILRWLDRAIPGKSHAQLKEATELLKNNEHAKAMMVLEEIVSEDNGNVEARVLLAGESIGDSKRVKELLSGIEEDSEFHPLADSLLTIVDFREKGRNGEALAPDPARDLYLSALTELGAENYDGALAAFIDVIRTNREYDDDGARKACVAIFRFLGEDHKTTRKYRRDFAGALNA